MIQAVHVIADLAKLSFLGFQMASAVEHYLARRHQPRSLSRRRRHDPAAGGGAA